MANIFLQLNPCRFIFCCVVLGMACCGIRLWAQNPLVPGRQAAQLDHLADQLTDRLAASTAGQLVKPAAGAAEQTIVLKNGNVVFGQVDKQKDLVVITTSVGLMRLYPKQIDQIYPSLAEAYYQKSSALHERDFWERLSLADWCIRQKMFVEAKNELILVKKTLPNHPRLKLLERRITNQQQAEALRKKRAGGISTKSRLQTQQPGRDSHLMQASYVELSQAQVFAEIDLPKNVKLQFRRVIQPMLVQSCTLSGCHSPSGAQEFKLDRRILSSRNNTRLTNYNLQQLLRGIIGENPLKSQVFTLANKPHFNHRWADKMVLNRRQMQIFETWLHAIQNNASEAPTFVGKLGLEAGREKALLRVPKLLPPVEETGMQPLKMSPPEKNGSKKPVLSWQKEASLRAALTSQQYRTELQAEQAELIRQQETELPRRGDLEGQSTEDRTREDQSVKTGEPQHKNQQETSAEKALAEPKRKNWQPRDKFDPDIFNRLIKDK